MSLDLTQVILCVLVACAVLFAYVLGTAVGEAREKARAERVRRNLAKSRRAW